MPLKMPGEQDALPSVWARGAFDPDRAALPPGPLDLPVQAAADGASVELKAADFHVGVVGEDAHVPTPSRAGVTRDVEVTVSVSLLFPREPRVAGAKVVADEDPVLDLAIGWPGRRSGGRAKGRGQRQCEEIHEPRPLSVTQAPPWRDSRPCRYRLQRMRTHFKATGHRRV